MVIKAGWGREEGSRGREPDGEVQLKEVIVFDCVITLENRVQTMSVLKLKLDKAAEQFQIHNFKESLALYEDCLAFCYRTRESQTVVFNIMSTKGALLCILGELQRAMSTLNEVLRADPSHYLALVRRSQVYKKKGKLNRAQKDLDMIASFCPDNLQVAAMRIEIENLKARGKANDSSEEESEEEEADEETQLNFSNLKKIDRKSCSIVIGPLNGRKSRVTISGDTAFEYEREEDGNKSFNSTEVSKEQLKEKDIRTLREIEMEKDVGAPASQIVAKPNPRSKSILKNKLAGSGLGAVQLGVKEGLLGRESHLIEKLKNIDGKVISSNHSLEGGSNKSLKEVQFRKSGFASQEKQFSATVPLPPQKAKQHGRKSCLKRSSFQNIQKEVAKAPVRKSKFEMMARNSIDGAVIKNRKSIDVIKEVEKEGKQDDESDEGSSYNIFGSTENVVISKEMKEKLGLGKESSAPKAAPKQRANGGKSILKKNSVLMSEPNKRSNSSEVPDSSEEKLSVNRPKKSVMFTRSRFAE